MKHRGAQSELLACAWLFDQSYEVYRNTSAVGIADLAVYNPSTGDWFLVDVKTGSWAQGTEEQRIHGIRLLGVTVTDGRLTCKWLNAKPKPVLTAHQRWVRDARQMAKFQEIAARFDDEDDDDEVQGGDTLATPPCSPRDRLRRGLAALVGPH
jgi:hypothetical protein